MKNANEFSKIGEHHPDGPTVSVDKRNQSDTLNFGWFSLPQAKKGFVPREDPPKTPEVDMQLENSTSLEYNQRPLSKDGHRPDSQQRKTPQQCALPGEGPLTESQTTGQQHYLEDPGSSEKQEQSFSPISHNQAQRPMHAENVSIEWPLSALARDNMVKQQQKSNLCGQQPRTPVGRSDIREVPSTPLPPLQWQGYQNSSRPTYSSWHDNWYQNRDVIPTNTKGHVMDTNNSNHEKDTECKNHSKVRRNKNTVNKRSATNNRGKNANNNNDTCETSIVSFNSQPIACNYEADSNNNNWMNIDDHGSSPKTQVTTIPPYEQSSETIPGFYSPNVVMKWEDTEVQSNSKQERQSFKQTSLMKRIRSSLFQMWSILSCLKNQDDETATQSCKSFKYDRFDYNNKYKSTEQRDHN